jgi:DNA-directed RNA polymerase specialized sigma24 family protein
MIWAKPSTRCDGRGRSRYSKRPIMTTPDDLLNRARRLQTEPVEQIVTESYPAVVRMARGLVGNEPAAKKVVDTVIGNSLRVLPTWRAGAVPSNWFYHHTLLAARWARAHRSAGEIRNDLLVAAAAVKDVDPAGAIADPEYWAFVRALRNLPPQQMEAFLLHHGERLNTRLLGVAMDCSMAAATNHLTAATAAMETVAGESGEEMIGRLERAYWSLGPAAASALPNIRGQVRRLRWSRRIRTAFRRVVLLAALGSAGWAVWHFRDIELQWIAMLREQLSPTQSTPATQPSTSSPATKP